MTYVAIAIAIITSYVLKRTRTGLELRAVGENPATADAAGININRYKYFSICIGCMIAGIGGLYYVLDYASGVWSNDAFGDRGWLAIALVIFSIWRPNWAIWESMLFGVLWSCWHIPLLFIKGTYQAGLMVNPLYVINFFVSGPPLGFIITWVYLASDRSILACMIYHLFVNFMQEKIAMTPETKCVETIVVTIVAIFIVITNKDMFFETRHVGRLLETRYNDVC